MEPSAAPTWVLEEVLPTVQGRVRSVQMLHDKAALVFLEDHAVVAEKSAFKGLRMYRADFPPGFLVNAANCPHCGQAVREPIGKVARLAPEKRTVRGRKR